uniref:ribosomal protein L22 n=1 Tax=Erycibe obtusifolia TaxID=1603722 RepID=UPI001EDDB184|nr:ribosomal protein L22 [Erycibe obtusifolia]UKO32220.1 ribosomal protein L22 [Erycibe obtusifolia]BDR61691.1 ribosomal protein L22 [Erycibe henryi]
MYQVLKKKKKKSEAEVYALGQHISMSADKARRVIDQIRERPYEETLMILELMPYRASYPILKLLYSAAANASYTMASTESDLFISKAEVNEGTTVKKFKPRARGRSYPIKRPTCHITIVLKDVRILLDNSESVEFNLLKKPRWKKNSIAREYYDLHNRRGLWDKK